MRRKLFLSPVVLIPDPDRFHFQLNLLQLHFQSASPDKNERAVE